MYLYFTLIWLLRYEYLIDFIALPQQGCKLSTQMCLSDTHSRQLKDLDPWLTFDLTVPARCNLYDDVEWYDVTYLYIWSPTELKTSGLKHEGSLCYMQINDKLRFYQELSRNVNATGQY